VRVEPRRRATGVAAVLIAAVLVAGCGGGSAKAVARDGSPRRPDDEGVATALTRERITLDGKRTYSLSSKLVSFSTYTPLTLEPVLNRKGQYVQVGLHDDEVVWLAGVGPVVTAEGNGRVFYNGRLRKVTGGRIEFDDGTVFRSDKGITAPRVGVVVQVELDPVHHRAVKLTARS
jgi:hypothetical protein